MTLTQDQVNEIVEASELYQTEMELAANRFRRHLERIGFPPGPSGRLIDRERYYRAESERAVIGWITGGRS